MEPTAALFSLVQQLDRSQWAPSRHIHASQLHHAARLADHCFSQSPAFASRLADAGLHPSDLADASGFVALPVLTRRAAQSAGDDLFCREIPAGHGETVETQTSGSTGEPVTVRRTAVSTLFWNAMAMRELRWHGRDLAGRLCAIRANVSTVARTPDWGVPASLYAPTGEALSLPITADVRCLVSSVVDFQPTTLVIYPTTLDAFATYCQRQRIAIPSLRHVLTIGETLSARIRHLAGQVFGASLADCYSSQELGYIAAECPVSGRYHVMAESVLAEVLNREGKPCGPGEVGRVILTDLHNYATPLVRYDIGDYAEVAAPCPCGRGLPTWTRILGRERNFILMPDGTRFWPVTGFPNCRDIAPVAQYQFIQESRHTIEARLVVERTLSPKEEDDLRSLFHKCAGYPFTLRFTYFPNRIPSAPSGKFEEFVCRVIASDVES